jgi:hypothetical protein
MRLILTTTLMYVHTFDSMHPICTPFIVMHTHLDLIGGFMFLSSFELKSVYLVEYSNGLCFETLEQDGDDKDEDED